MPSKVMTPEQVADLLQINPATVYRYIRQNRLEASRLGRHYRITRQAVDRFLRSNSNASDVRAALFDRVARVAERNRGVKDVEVMRVLEELDAEVAPAQ
jgi:excisionase family DNA binding protein